MADRMTTREAIAIVREQAAKESGPVRDALLLCATIAEHHADRNRKNKRRQRARIKESEQCNATR